MSEKILVPVLGESITEATVSKWLKNEGDTVEADEPIVELETDIVNLEVPSPISGTLTKINSKDGSVVEVGALLGSVSENGSSSKSDEQIKKIQPSIKEDNVIKLETEKDEEEPKIFEDKAEELEVEEKPLVLTEEIKDTLEPGDVLYIPNKAFHYCQPKGKRLSLSFAINFHSNTKNHINREYYNYE